IPPKFEIFSDRIEITSAGSLPDNMTQDEFFEGYSIPRNKELMRVFRDLEMVEQLGTGIHRILKSYGKDCFRFTENFTRITFPIVEGGLGKELGLELTDNQIKIIKLITSNPNITIIEMAKQAQLGATTIENNLGKLQGLKI